MSIYVGIRLKSVIAKALLGYEKSDALVKYCNYKCMNIVSFWKVHYGKKARAGSQLKVQRRIRHYFELRKVDILFIVSNT